MDHINTIILVEDLAKERQFYEEILGLKIQHDWEVMMVYQHRFALHQIDKVQPQEWVKQYFAGRGKSKVVIYLELDKEDSIEDKLRELKEQGVKILHEIYELPWQKIFRIEDPEGNCIEIGSAIKEE